ncbi:MAG: hypothetical protein A4E19_20410 [Nitrospira sp. SG-bin1]|nr:MAG: hypothetical protein A4E19_20410 [Nitrospira sp. SG-bin1]
MKPLTLWHLGVACVVGLLSGCSGSDNVPIVPPSGPTASVDDQRTPESDALTSEEAALVGQANSEPDPSPQADL